MALVITLPRWTEEISDEVQDAVASRCPDIELMTSSIVMEIAADLEFAANGHHKIYRQYTELYIVAMALGGLGARDLSELSQKAGGNALRPVVKAIVDQRRKVAEAA